LKPLLESCLPAEDRVQGKGLVWRLLASLAGWMRSAGCEVKRIAALLGAGLRTTWRLLGGTYRGPGRPRVEMAEEDRNEIEALLADRGGRVSVDYLKRLFPSSSRRAIRELKRAWVKRAQAMKRAFQQALQWLEGGRAWALDGAFAPEDIEEKGDRFLVARDVASKYTLGVIAAPETSEEAIRFLKSLFDEYGKPLVLKTDNGPGFTAEETQSFLEEEGVIPLLSPAYRPQYNGAIERGMQDVKGFAEATATLANRPGIWLQEDLQKAVSLANTREVKREGTWQSPQLAHAQRKPISQAERVDFLGSCAAAIKQEMEAIAPGLATAKTKRDEDRLIAKATRLGVTQALIQGGYLTVEEGRLSQPVTGAACATIIEG